MTFGLEEKKTTARVIVALGTIVSSAGVVVGAFLAYKHEPIESVGAVAAAFALMGNRLTKIAKLIDPTVSEAPEST